MDNIAKPQPKTSNTKTPSKKKKIISISVLVIGLITLIVGVVFLVINLINASKAADGDFLVKTGKWVLEDESGVIWDFTEVGKGTLTTNNHLNDYDFIWAIEDNQLKIETDWLYDLENTYEYQLDQGTNTLTLTDADGKTHIFKASTN